MKRPNFWTLMVLKDDYILSAIEVVIRISAWFDFQSKKAIKQARRIIESKKTNGSIYIVLNGPSLHRQDLARLQGRDLMFVNRGFLHPLYKDLRPKYHVFIDSKMVKGIWDVTWIDQILEMVPDITLVLPAKWARLDMFQKYIVQRLPIIWLPEEGRLRGIGVAGACFDLSMQLGYKTIYFTGFEATSFAHYLLQQASHFYGVESDGEERNAEVYMRGYYMNCRQIRELIVYERKARNRGIRMINLTDGGLLDMFPRENIDDSVNAKGL